MSRKLLQLDYNYDFDLIGIVSSARIYKLCWDINNVLRFNLERIDDLQLTHTKLKIDTTFARYIQKNENDEELSDFLVANKSSAGLLIPERKEADYFLVLNTEYDVKDVSNKLKSLSSVQTVFTLDVSKLKSKENLVF
ncbi:IPExxxVDY family protein [bacterium AH-315-C07]|nr:IPExxxVDY family protein [bacterium AH-315-C07]